MDDTRCPSCGFSKAAWTAKIDRTRLFRLSGQRKTFEGDVDDQIDALKDAAQNGTPFCEKCMKALYGDDGPTQADALKDAAKDGTPFCEKCEKHRREQAQKQEAAAGTAADGGAT